MVTAHRHRTLVVESFTAVHVVDGKERIAVWRLLKSGAVSYCVLQADGESTPGALRWVRSAALPKLNDPVRVGHLSVAVERLGWRPIANGAARPVSTNVRHEGAEAQHEGAEQRTEARAHPHSESGQLLARLRFQLRQPFHRGACYALPVVRCAGTIRRGATA
jgi:hypothetical protein